MQRQAPAEANGQRGSPPRGIPLAAGIAVAAMMAAGCAELEAPKGGVSAYGEDSRAALKIIAPLASDTFPAGTSEKDNPYVRWIEESAGFSIDWTAPPSSGYQNKLNVRVAAGESYDLIHTSDLNWIVGLAKTGAIQPLDEPLEKYGQSLLAGMPQRVWEAVTIDGRLYAIPKFAKNPGDSLFIRKDWLDKLGLDVPRSLDDFVRVMRAFKEEDPDGNGRHDTYGLTIGTSFQFSSPFFAAFGVPIAGLDTGEPFTKYWVEREGRLVSPTVLPEMKEAVRFFAGLYSEGLLDPEFPLNKKAVVARKVAEGKVGLYAGYYHETRTAIAESVKHDPAAEWIAIGYPVGPAGFSGTGMPPEIVAYNIVPSDSRHAEEVVRLLDWMIGEGYKTLRFGFEGEVYTMRDGEMAIDAEESTRVNYRQRLIFVAPDDWALDRQRLEALGPQFGLVAQYELAARHEVPNRFTGPPTPAMVRYNSKLDRLAQETFVRMVTGVTNVEEFERFVRTWKAEGGDEIEKEVNEWYARKSRSAAMP